jgi:hypothetical protein
MRIFAVITVALVILAAGAQLYLMQQDQSALLLKLLLSQPLPQQAAWVVMVIAPVLLFFAALWGHQHRNARKALAAKLHGVTAEIMDLHNTQKDNEDAASYLNRSDPQQAVSDVRRRLSETEQLIEIQHGRNESSDLAAYIEQIREHQKAIRQRLGCVIAKRTTLEATLAELQTFQDEAEQAMGRMEEDKNGDTLETRVRKLVDFARDAHFRCDEVERSMHGVQQQQKEFDTIQSRLAPLVDAEGGVRKRLRVLQDARAELIGNLEAIERDGGIPLADRVQQLAEGKSDLEQRVSEANLRCEEVERALHGLLQQQQECDVIKARLVPLLDSENGVRPRLRALQETQIELVGSLEAVERDGGIPLGQRVQKLAENKTSLEQRVSALLEQVAKIDTVQKEITAVFAKLNQAHRVSRELESHIRVVS